MGLPVGVAKLDAPDWGAELEPGIRVPYALAMRALIVCSLLVCAGCKGDGSSAPASASSGKSGHPDWRTTGAYAPKRAALKSATNAFPASLTDVPRCKPDRKGVLLLSYNTARLLLAPKAPEAPDVGIAPGIDVGARRLYLESIERAAWETSMPEERAQWDKAPFEDVSAVALFRATSVTLAKMGECVDSPAGKNCKLSSGVIAGDVVVFDDNAKPVCANALEIEGPSSALVRVGGRVDDMQRVGAEQILGGYFYGSQETPTADAPWRFLSLSQTGTSPPKLYTIKVDGKIVQTMSAD